MKLRALVCLVAALTVAGEAAAQDVHLRGDDDTRAARLAREVLQRSQYIRIDRDTVLPASFQAPGDLVVVDADVRLEGSVAGTAVVLGGDLYLRPGSRVDGSIAVVDGGVYPSGKATYGTIFESNPSSRVTVTEEGAEVEVALDPPDGPSLISPLIMFPSYNRVDGVSFPLGFVINPARREGGPTLSVWGDATTERRDDPGGGVRLDVLVSQGVRVIAEGSSDTRTNDAWARGDLGNSLAALFAGRDYRDYYRGDRLSLSVARPLGKALIEGESWWGPRIGARVEEASSLETRNPWSLMGELDRVNPPVLDAQINSLVVGSELHWVGRLSRITLDAEVERGHVLGSPAGFSPDFTQLTAFARYQATAFRTHTLKYHVRAMLPVGGDSAPPQRYSILGDIPTLPTQEIGEQRGDHLVFAEGTYTIPFQRIMLPFIGSPSLELRHAVGAAWIGGDDQEWVQNVGAGILFRFVGVRVAVDPADTGDTRVYFAISAPTPAM
jgi:hypothetical protein